MFFNFIRGRKTLDPLNEEKFEVIKGLVWKYNKRVLLELTLACVSYCPYCTRIRKVGEKNKYYLSKRELEKIIEYIKSHREIDEVIISGGDPVTVPDYLKYVLNKLEKIKHIKIVRIHTKFPRLIDLDLIKKFKKQLYILIHVDRYEDIDKIAIKKIRDLGISMFSQSVFVKGINDNSDVLAKIFTRLLELGVKPYYIYHCDKVAGLERYRVNLKKEIKIMRELRDKISGLAYPIHIVDTAKRKIPVGFRLGIFQR
jgi:lysine 2,3-aminomutase